MGPPQRRQCPSSSHTHFQLRLRAAERAPALYFPGGAADIHRLSAVRVSAASQVSPLALAVAADSDVIAESLLQARSGEGSLICFFTAFFRAGSPLAARSPALTLMLVSYTCKPARLFFNEPGRSETGPLHPSRENVGRVPANIWGWRSRRPGGDKPGGAGPPHLVRGRAVGGRKRGTFVLSLGIAVEFAPCVFSFWMLITLTTPP